MTTLTNNFTYSTQRRHAPCFTPDPDFKPIRLVRYALARLAKKDFSLDNSLRVLRERGAELVLYYKKDGQPKTKYIDPRKTAIRIERGGTLRELSKVLITYCNYSPDGPYFFEVKYNIETIAMLIGQIHRYAPSKSHPNGRVAYDCVLGALHDFEASGQIVVVREFDYKAGTNKANRIFLTPLFFTELGFTRKEMLSLMRELKRTKEKYNTNPFLEPKENERGASVKQHPVYVNLKKIAKDFLSDCAILSPVPKEKTVPRNTSTAPKPVKATLQTRISALKQKISPALYYVIEADIKGLNLPFDEEQQQIYDALLCASPPT